MDLQTAVRDLQGVAAVTTRWPDPKGPALLRVEFHGGSPTEHPRLAETVGT